MKLRTFKIGGIHPKECKLTAEIPTVCAPIPAKAIFPLSQHIGAPAVPVVKRGDKVKVGTKIAEAGGFVSAPLFSSVSGTVEKIDSVFDATGYRVPAIVVKVEGDEWEDSIDRTDKIESLADHPELTPEKIVEKVKEAGVTGMGGAGFPSYIKLSPPKDATIDAVVINGVECEPYITSDYRLMIEHADEIIVGIELIMKAVSAPKAYIGIEINKPKAISLFISKTKNISSIEVVALKKRYPQGGEKQLVDAVLGREVPPPPAIPATIGVVVQNVGTAFAIYQAVMKNKPLFERYTTVTGKNVTNPQNFLVRMGTPIKILINVCGGLPDGDIKLIAGGPMMGKALVSETVPVCKGTNCVTILSGAESKRKSLEPCIRCAKCVSVCPMGLEPYLIATLSARKRWEPLEDEFITSCIECGSCQYTFPAHRPLLDNIRIGKSAVMKRIKVRKQSKPTVVK